MKPQIAVFILAAGLSAHAQKFQFQEVPPQKTPVTPRVVVEPPALQPATDTSVQEQKPVSSRKILVTTEQSQQVIEKFKEAYLKLGSPRILIYVNRELSDEPKAKLDETVRDIERLFGKPLRAAEAKLADQKIANKMMAGKILKAPTKDGDAKAADDRDGLRKIADVAIEVLISSKQVKISGDKMISVPDVQATAIRLEDARIIGMAASADFQDADVRDVSEAVVLSLMEDIVKEAK